MYSNAHIFDLQQDTTDTKYAEMDFMLSVVDCNHLIYNAPEIVVATESPRSAFDNMAKMNDFSWLDNFDFSQLTQEQKIFINNMIDVSNKGITGKLDFDWITKRKPIRSEDLMVDKATFTSLTKYVAKNFFSNNNQYKEIRDNVIAHYNPNQITADNKRSFNEQLASSPLGLSFIDTIKAVLDQTGLHNVDNPTTYYISYMLLDMFGVSKDPRKKVKIHNLQVDSCHSFFGSYCDCIVSDDDGLRRKSQALYNLFHCSTHVYSIDEFIEKFDEAIYNNQKKLQEYFNEVISDYNHRQVVKSEKISEYTLTYIKSTHKYFGYFNCMLERQSKDETAIILYKDKGIYQPLHLREVEIVVNRLVNVFNEIGVNLPLFDSEVEFPHMKDGKWGRTIILDDCEIYLTRFEKHPMLCLFIKLKKSFAK